MAIIAIIESTLHLQNKEPCNVSFPHLPPCCTFHIFPRPISSRCRLLLCQRVLCTPATEKHWQGRLECKEQGAMAQSRADTSLLMFARFFENIFSCVLQCVRLLQSGTATKDRCSFWHFPPSLDPLLVALSARLPGQGFEDV